MDLPDIFSNYSIKPKFYYKRQAKYDICFPTAY